MDEGKERKIYTLLYKMSVLKWTNSSFMNLEGLGRLTYCKEVYNRPFNDINVLINTMVTGEESCNEWNQIL